MHHARNPWGIRKMLTSHCALSKRGLSGNRPLLARLTADSMTTNPKGAFTPRRLRLIFCPFFVAAAAVALARIVAAGAMDGTDRVDVRSAERCPLPCRTCDPISLLLEDFDGVTPPALPSGWSSITWETSNSGVPMPPADTPPNAAFVDDPATISDKQLLSPN